MSEKIGSENAERIKQRVEEIVKRSGSSFYPAMRLLGKEKRDAMFAVYAFCREIDEGGNGDG